LKGGAGTGTGTGAPSAPSATGAPKGTGEPSVTLKPDASADGKGGAFANAKQKADKVEVPLAAVGIWQAFIDSNPNSPDLEAAKAELEKWKQLNKDQAEKINGKWVSGEERKKLLKKVESLLEEAIAAEENNTINAIKKYEEAVKLYPNSFEAHFRLGYFYLLKGGPQNRDKSIGSLEHAVRIQPSSPEALSNLAIAYSFRKRHEQAVLTAHKAVRAHDSKELVENLLACFNYAPVGMQTSNTKMRPIMEEARVLARKYNIGGAPDGFHYLPPGYTKKEDGGGGGGSEEDESKGPPGVFANGTGFFISPDGYIMTNEHVAKPGDYLMVRLSDGTEKLAKRIVIDDEQDIAIIKIKVDKPVPFIRLAPYDSPKIGADVAVLGFPLLSIFGMNSSLKITRGIVTAYDKDQDKCDVTVDAQVNPGNSGGPMVDKHGNLLALVAMKTRADETISSYGLGLSTGRLRTFIEKQKSHFPELTLDPGSEDGTALSTEELADKLTPATVCILMMRGEDPGSESIDSAPADGAEKDGDAAKKDSTPPAAKKGGAAPEN
jgi:S1-C subfamily serine protease